MSETPTDPANAVTPAAISPKTRAMRLRRWTIRGMAALAIVVGIWLILAYVILPMLWRHYEHNPALADAPKTTLTSQRIPGDPLNVGLIGGEEEVVKAMHAAGWSPADPITLKSTVRIATSVVFKRPDPDAPVSGLYLFGRRQDLAFEKAVGGNARHRHHVRFWQWTAADRAGQPLWIGSATFDISVGFSHLTGQVTHHIAADIDAERHSLIEDLIAAGWLSRTYQVTGVGATIAGRNGGGDRYFTDGELTIGVLASNALAGRRPDRLPNPPAVQIKEQLWSAIGPLLQATTPSP
ncbi:MAG TPA: LssY C-terminal domain-containing protein [Isosphaeraceae bacterium]|nr:LssY C-terminal domain-containing protein [Isosphaeraceae bacterium]